MTPDAFKRQLEAHRAEYRRDLPAKLAELGELWRGLASGALKPARLGDLQRELHTLAGTAKTFGVAGVSEAAAVAESLLEPYCRRSRLPGAAKRAEFERLLEALKRSGTAQ
jgi:chemotaxis protein histidine kinase CheA